MTRIPLFRIVGALTLLASLVACSLLGAGQGNPAEPVLVTGRVVDAESRPVGGAAIELYVNDYGAAINVGDVVPEVFHRSFSAGPDGTFALHLAPTAELRAFGAKEGGFVNFNMVARVDGAPAPWSFPRELLGPTWAGEVPVVELHPIGSGGPGPVVPAPEPAAT